MPFCNKCGVETKQNGRFCSNCGNALEVSDIEKNASTKLSQSANEIKKEHVSADINVMLHKSSPLAMGFAGSILILWEKISRKYLSQRWFKYWIIAHSIMLLLTLTGGDFINAASYSPSKNHFWPFSGFTYTEIHFSPTYYFGQIPNSTETTHYAGFLYCYDVSEFIIYLILGIIIAHIRSRK
jgi:hypothetical protein